MYNKQAKPAFLRFGSPSQCWLSILMRAVARVTQHDSLGAGFLATCFRDSVTGEELNRGESLSSNQSTTLNQHVLLSLPLECELKQVIIDRQFTEYTLRSVFQYTAPIKSLTLSLSFFLYYEL